ncbi:HlyD family secretion protein [Palleronia salina]|uniref:HlyD family secretion protein n=1 Tax=Palleronia salina TaxID=313368 RepID=A0A1M6FV35_9RHOB|nr:HlyD family efflux transporter periplasmic adaptor subunit [Palleronia salina]SHJ01538.1 HlyD family secretion protein [Palleronia salina]
MTHAPDTSPAPLSAGNEHPLIDIPFTAVIDGRRYSGGGLSMTTAQVTGLIDRGIDGTQNIVRLIFDFPGFQLALSPAAQVRVIDDNTGVLVFSEPTGDHSAQLRQVLNDYISGDLTSSGRLIRSGALAQPKNGGSGAPGKPTIGQRVRSGAATLVVLALTVALIALAVSLMQARLFTTDIAAPGRVVPEGQTIRATADGQISFIDAEAQAGDVLFALDTVDGETLSIAMPIDGVAQPISVTEGSTVLAGEPLFAVSPDDAALTIEARLPQELLFEVQQTGGVDVTLPGGAEFRATLAEGFRAPGAVGSDGLVRTNLVPSIDLPDGTAGQVAALSVTRDAFGVDWTTLTGEALTEARAFRDETVLPIFNRITQNGDQ